MARTTARVDGATLVSLDAMPARLPWTHRPGMPGWSRRPRSPLPAHPGASPPARSAGGAAAGIGKPIARPRHAASGVSWQGAGSDPRPAQPRCDDAGGGSCACGSPPAVPHGGRTPIASAAGSSAHHQPFQGHAHLPLHRYRRQHAMWEQHPQAMAAGARSPRRHPPADHRRIRRDRLQDGWRWRPCGLRARTGCAGRRRSPPSARSTQKPGA